VFLKIAHPYAIILFWRRVRVVSTAFQFPHKVTALEIYKHENLFKVSHNKEFHNVEILARN
jgi:hypothetical protein